MRYSPRSVFTGKDSNGNNIKIYEWDYETYSNFEFISNLTTLLIGLALSAISAPLLLIMCIVNYNGRHKPFYVIGILISTYFIYDCKHGWLVMQAVNLLFGENILAFLLGCNVASIILFSIFLLVGIRLHNFIEDLIPTVEGRWAVFIIFVSIIALISITTTYASKEKGWAMYNIKFESESDKKERHEEERIRDLGDFESQEAKDKYFEDLERRCGDRK